MDNGMPYRTLNAWCREHYGEKLYKIALDAGLTCPNRDGTLESGAVFSAAPEAAAILPRKRPGRSVPS